MADAESKQRSSLVTILFTDMVGSTALKQRLGDLASSAFFDRHHRIVRESLGQFPNGQEIETAGDSFLITFDAPSDAVQFALLLQSRLQTLSAAQNAGALDRIGIYVGEVVIKENQSGLKPRDLFGIPIDTCARIMSLATGGQILMSRFAFDASRPMLHGDQFAAVQWLNHGPYQLKGIDEPIEVCEVRPAGSATAPPTSSDKASRLATDGNLVLGWRPALEQLVPNTRWKLISKLGEGGFGEVWLGHHEVLKEKRVFKFCFKAELVRSLKRELTLFRLLKEKVGEHPNIASIREVNFDTAPYYIEMDYVPGRDLKAWCEAKGGSAKILEGDKLELIAQIADALQGAHQCGIVHRDVKPGNILVSDSNQVAAKLTDFGIGQVLSEEFLAGTTRAGFTQTMMGTSTSGTGTQMYMAPELLAGKPASPRSDLYSLGVVLYQLLIGDFTQALTIDWSRRITDPLLREDLEKCLAGDLNERFGSAAELARNLRNIHTRRAELAKQQAEATQRERAAYREGMMKTAGWATVLILLFGTLAIIAYNLYRQARAESFNAAYSARQEKEQRLRADAEKAAARRLLYGADINLAQQAVNLNNLGRARRLLDRHRPQAGQDDIRGWEWRYLWQLTQSGALATLTNRPVRGFSTSFSHDGARLALGWLDGRVDVWDVPGRRRIRALTEQTQPLQGRVAFSPVRNLLAATSGPQTVTLYDLDSNRDSILWKGRAEGAWYVRDLAFSQDGSKIVLYAGGAARFENEVWVVDLASGKSTSFPAAFRDGLHIGAAQLSPDNQRLYLPRSERSQNRYTIHCIDLSNGKELWQSEPQSDLGITTLAISPDGGVLASGSGYGSPTIRVWDTSNGRPLARLDGHTSWISKLVFTKDGRRLFSASADQSIRFWDTSTWTQARALRGHSDEVHSVAISETARLVASAGKDGNLLLWNDDATSAADGHLRLPEKLKRNEPLLPLEQSRVLLLPTGQPPSVFDLKTRAQQSLPEFALSTNILDWFPTNIFCHWDGTNRILVSELRGTEFIQKGAITLDAGQRPARVSYDSTHQLLAWTQMISTNSIFVANLATPNLKIEIKSNGPQPDWLSVQFGTHLAARATGYLRVWSLKTRQLVVSLNAEYRHIDYAAGGRVMVATFNRGATYEVEMYDLAIPGSVPRRIPATDRITCLAVSPNGKLVTFGTQAGLVQVFDPIHGTVVETLHAHLNAVWGIAFSPDGSRLISTSSTTIDTVKLWEVSAWQELLTLSGIGSLDNGAKWTGDGNAFLNGSPWEAWIAPTWEEIAAAESIPK